MAGDATVVGAWLPAEAEVEPPVVREVARPAPSETTGTRGDAATRPARILVVDDEPQIVEFLCVLLEDEGYRATRAYDGADALEKVRGDRLDLVITDVMMPRLTGLQFVQRLRENLNGTCPPVILMSAVTRLHEAPGVRFLPKPFDIDRMLDLVSELVGQ
jgi:DNA-binding response OmpR family regulator